MPAFYAHYRFGISVFRNLNKELKTIIRKYKEPFQMGLQGPDVFFFYKAYKKNAVSDYGYDIHYRSALPFFEHAIEVIKEKGRESKEYAYLLGFICHFILDSESHHYVEQMVKEIGVAHLEIEEEYEKRLLKMDGKNPFRYPYAKKVYTDRITAQAMEPFYGEIADEETIQKSLKWMKFVKKLFTAPCPVKQGMINQGMRFVGKYEEMKGLMNQRKENPRCKQTNRELLDIYLHAVPVAIYMIYDFDESVKNEKELNQRFDRNLE